MIPALPPVRGRLTPNRALSDLTWLRVGGPAEWLFQPADTDDLAGFMAALDPDIPVFVLGAGSNLIVRDGGLRGVVIRLGRPFAEITIDDDLVRVGAAALDARLAVRAAEAGRDLAFLRTIPGTLGGAVRMNAGCYGRYMADIVRSVTVVTRDGRIRELAPRDLVFGYRDSALPEGAIVTEVTLAPPHADPGALAARMDEQIARRDATQPVRERSAGSTFRNPAGYSSTGRADDSHALKAWSLIDQAGMRGARRGAAQMSVKHANFLVNTGGATATDLEGLGEDVRKRVREVTGIDLVWEIMRVGDRPT